MSKRKKYNAKFKAQVVKELISWRKTQAEITSEYGIHPTQQNKRKKQFEENLDSIFTDKRENPLKEQQKVVDWLYKQIGQLSYEVSWLQKKTWIKLELPGEM